MAKGRERLLSFGTIRKYFRDVIGVTISRGMLRKLVAKVTDSLLEPYEALLAMLPMRIG